MLFYELLTLLEFYFLFNAYCIGVVSELQVNFGTPRGNGGILSYVLIKLGSMVAYHGGNVSMEREGII